MRTALILVLATAALATSGCERLGLSRKTTSETSLPYRASLKADKEGLMQISVRANGASLAQVRESARYQATLYCMSRTGSSSVAWVLDPATGDWATVSDEKGTLSLQARCRRA